MLKKIFIMLLFCIFIDLLYVFILNPIGFTFSRVNLNPGVLKIIFSYFFCIFFACFLPKKASDFSGITIVFLYIVLIAPSVQVLKYASSDFYCILGLISIFLITFLSIDKMVSFSIKKLKLSKNFFFGLLASLFFLSMLSFFSVYGIVPRVLSFSSADVYSVRVADRVALGAQSGLVRYILSWYPRFFVGLFMYYFFINKKYFIVFFLFVLGFYNFSISSHKAQAFLPLFLFILLFYFKKRQYIDLSEIVLLYMCAILSFLIVSFISGKILFIAFIDRIVSVHGDLFAKYFEFFSQNPKAFWGYSFLKGFFDYPYLEWPGMIIGEFGYKAGMNANAHFLADGYANAGAFGILFYTVFISVFCKIIDAFHADVLCCILFSFIFTMYIASTSPLSAMLTAGFIWLPIVLFLGLSRKRNELP